MIEKVEVDESKGINFLLKLGCADLATKAI